MRKIFTSSHCFWIAVLVQLFFTLPSFSQSTDNHSSTAATSAKSEEKDSTNQEQRSHFGLSMNYLSNAVYNGRHDSLTTTTLSPSFGYFSKSGFSLFTSLSYVNNMDEHQINQFALSAGYEFPIIKDHLSAGLNANRYFNNSANTQVNSDEKGDIGAGLNCDLNFISISVGSNVVFTSKTDFSSDFSVSKEFKIEGKNGASFSLNPTVSGDLSTLNFYEGYINRRIKKNVRKKQTNLMSVSSTTTITSHQAFTLLDWGFQLPMGFEAKNWGIALTPQMALPLNPVTTTTTTVLTYKNNKAPVTETVNSTPASERNLKPEFFFELGIHYNLFTKQVATK